MNNLAITHYATDSHKMHYDEKGNAHPCKLNCYIDEDTKYDTCEWCEEEKPNPIRDLFRELREDDLAFREMMFAIDAADRQSPSYYEMSEEASHD